MTACWKTSSTYPFSDIQVPIDYAVVQQLYIPEWNSTPYLVSGKVSDQKALNRYNLMYKRAHYTEAYVNQQMLQPGKCIVLFAGGTQNYMQYNNKAKLPGATLPNE